MPKYDHEAVFSDCKAVFIPLFACQCCLLILGHSHFRDTRNWSEVCWEWGHNPKAYHSPLPIPVQIRLEKAKGGEMAGQHLSVQPPPCHSWHSGGVLMAQSSQILPQWSKHGSKQEEDWIKALLSVSMPCPGYKSINQAIFVLLFYLFFKLVLHRHFISLRFFPFQSC